MIDYKRERPPIFISPRTALPQEVNSFGCMSILSGPLIETALVIYNGKRGVNRNHSAWSIKKQKNNGSYNHVGMYGYNFSFDSLISAQNIYGPGSPTKMIAFWPNHAAEVGNKVAEDFKQRYLPKNTENKMTTLQTIISGKNAEFHNAFLTEWNSGSCSRDYETYCRQIRQALGINNYFRTKNFMVRNIETSVEKIEEYFASKNWQVVFGSEKFFWVMYVVDNIPILFGEAKFKDNLMTVTFEGERESILLAIKEISSLFSDVGIQINNLLNITPQGEDVQTSYIFPAEHDVAKIHFYPWLKEYADSLEEFYDEYLNSSKSVLLLIGPPGGGKSTFLRTLLFHAKKEKNYICSNERVLSVDGFIPWISGLYDNSLIAIEDADKFVTSREKTGNDSMAGLLNATDGIIPRHNKIIISTNLPSINSVDPALVRPGRCHRVLEFKNLTYAEACHIREMENLPVFDVDQKREYSLAEVLCGEDLKDMHSRKKTSIGFA